MAQVEYELSLKDMMTPGLKTADGAVNKLEHSIHSASQGMNNFGARMLETIGITALFYKGFEFIHESVEQYHKLEQANAQVNAGLISTAHAAGLTSEEMEKGARQMSSQFAFTRAEITGMQSVMLTFPGITKKTFDEAAVSILDMSTRLHKGLDETAIMVGKALQDPERGITAMRRVGVNFNDTQTEIIKNLVRTGHAAEAQKRILSELNLEFGGSAAAAAAADPLFRYNKTMEQIGLSVGGLVTNLKEKLAPVLEFTASGFQSVTHWMERHKEIVELITDILLPVTGAILGVALAVQTWTAVQWLLNIAISANPIGALIVGLAAVAGGVVYCYKHFAQFRATIWATWAVIKEFASIVGDVFMGIYHVIHGAFHLNPTEIANGMMQSAGAIRDAGIRLGIAVTEGYRFGMKDFTINETQTNFEKKLAHLEKMAGEGTITANAYSNAISNLKSELNKDYAGGIISKDFFNNEFDVLRRNEKLGVKRGGAKPEGPEGKSETKGAKGNKVVTINIKIDALQKGDIKIMTTNIKEGTAKIQELITQSLMNAVNNSQIIAGG